jgi:DNA-binding response OmpR family regulator
MSGADLAGRIRAQQPDLRVLFMSGYTDEVISRHGVLDPGVDFIQKPFSPRALVSRVREVVDGSVRD